MQLFFMSHEELCSLEETMPYDLLRLEKSLRVWEDLHLLMSSGGHADVAMGAKPQFPLVGPMLYWQDYRKFLLESIPSDSPVGGEGMKKFIASEEHAAVNPFWTEFPIFLWHWNICSRRIYEVPADLKNLLLGTSFGSLTWEDVKLPFKSFALALEAPIEDAPGEYFDFVLCTMISHPGNERVGVLNLSMFSKRIEGYIPISVSDRAAMLEAVRRRNWYRLSQLFIKRDAVASKVLPPSKHDGIRFLYRFFMTDKITQSLSHITGSPDVVQDKTREALLRLVVGLSFYFKSLPPSKQAHSSWRGIKRGQELKGRCVTDEAEVCTVNVHIKSRRVLSKDVEDSESRGSEKSFHFRQGTWRRAPGTGHDPDAPRIVHQRWTMVRPDKREAGSLPQGRSTQLV